MRLRFLFLISICGLACLVPALGRDAAVRPDLDVARLQTGSFRYRNLEAGKEAGQGLIQIRRVPNSQNYQFSNSISGVFAQSWQTVASEDFSPLSAKLTFGEGMDVRPAFELAYQNGRVTGLSFPRKGQEPAEPRRVDEAIAADTVDQRIDWAAVMALKEYTPGEKFEFHVFDPGTGHSRLRAEVGETTITTVPAGSFETIHVTYHIEKNRGTETYEVFFTKKTPRFQVREKFPDGSVSDLLEQNNH